MTPLLAPGRPGDFDASRTVAMGLLGKLLGMPGRWRDWTARAIAARLFERVSEYTIVPLHRRPPISVDHARGAAQALLDVAEALIEQTQPTMDAARAAYRLKLAAEGHCMADSDGDCDWALCPQHRDGEPKKSGRSCPRWVDPDDEGRM